MTDRSTEEIQQAMRLDRQYEYFDLRKLLLTKLRARDTSLS